MSFAAHIRNFSFAIMSATEATVTAPAEEVKAVETPVAEPAPAAEPVEAVAPVAVIIALCQLNHLVPDFCTTGNFERGRSQG